MLIKAMAMPLEAEAPSLFWYLSINKPNHRPVRATWMKQVQKMESGDVPEKSSTARMRELNELGIFVESANSSNGSRSPVGLNSEVTCLTFEPAERANE
jgi:hypothetical protein